MNSGIPESLKLEIAINAIEIFREKHALTANNLAGALQQPPGHQAFNPSLTIHENTVHTLCRSSNVYIVNDQYWYLNNLPRSTDNYLGHLDRSGHTINPVKLDFSEVQKAHALTWLSIEDIRPFSWRGDLWGIGALYYSNKNNVSHEEEDLRAKQIVFKIVDNRALNHMILPSPLDCQFEKNWIPHVVDEELFLIYSVEPLTVFKLVDGQRLKLVSGKPERHDRIQLRGGSQLVELNEQLICVSHTMPIMANKIYYLHKFALISKEFKLLETSHPFFLHRRGVEFASGLIKQDDHLVLSYGVSDKRAYSVEVPIGVLENYLLL